MGLILDSVIRISRLTKDSDNTDKELYVDNAALQCVKCQIQPATATDTALANGVFGQTFLMFTAESGVLSGDLITVSGTGLQYRVRGVEDWSLPDIGPHFEMTLVQFEEEDILA